MEKIKRLNRYQKGILILMIAMAMIFAVIYPTTISRVGYRYNDAILVPVQENENIIYTGKIQGKQATFIVSDDNTVEFHYGEKTYGKYIMKEDPTAVPEDEELKDQMHGVEICNGDEMLFRGGVLHLGDSYLLYNEDGTLDNFGITFVTSDGMEWDEDGNAVDRMEPSASTIYELLNNPQLTHKGEAIAWYGAVCVCILNAIGILYADELFRYNLAFRIRNVESAEPSEWEMAGRYIGWTIMTLTALAIFIVGLQ